MSDGLGVTWLLIKWHIALGLLLWLGHQLKY